MSSIFLFLIGLLTGVFVMFAWLGRFYIRLQKLTKEVEKIAFKKR